MRRRIALLKHFVQNAGKACFYFEPAFGVRARRRVAFLRWNVELLTCNESFTESQAHPLDFRDRNRTSARTRRLVHMDKIFPRREGSLCKRRGAFQIWVARRRRRSRDPILSLAGFAARISRSYARSRWLQIIRRGLGRGTRNSGRLFEKSCRLCAHHEQLRRLSRCDLSSRRKRSAARCRCWAWPHEQRAKHA